MIAKQLNLRCYSRIFLRKILLFLSTHLRVTLALHCTLASPSTLHVMRVLVDLIWFPGTPPTPGHKLSSLSRCSSRSTHPTTHSTPSSRGASCAVPSGRTAKNIYHSDDTWTAWRPCASCSAASTRHSARTATRSRPKNICRASHLRKSKEREGNQIKLFVPRIGVSCMCLVIFREPS